MAARTGEIQEGEGEVPALQVVSESMVSEAMVSESEPAGINL